MAFIRDKFEELTGFQEYSDYNSNIDFQNDFVMVYGIDNNMTERIANYKSKGYVVHLMTGISWGEYQDYLYGEFDGKNHWDESQKDRNNNYIVHGKDVPYMVPTISFSNYLTEKIKPAIDSGVVAIHLEEPEFWEHGGYSEAFKREYELFYRQKWTPPHESIDSSYKSAKLKAYLFARTIDRVFGNLKEYAMVNYNFSLRLYVPTHSLLNYTQWKIISPEGALIDLSTVDGYIAQVWTGTSRTPNVFEGKYKERTFETSYLEYGIMQELVSGTGREMWFLHDPIEDNPCYTWENYKYNYLKTVIASLFHPEIYKYEICPWPNRVYNSKYPKNKKHEEDEKSEAIPNEYATLLNNIANTLGNMKQSENNFDGINSGVGVFMSDTCLFQRTYSDNILSQENFEKSTKKIQNSDFSNFSSEDYKAFCTSTTLPDFYGLALPLLKYGLPVRPVLLDNVRRFPDYLKGYKTLILSYEFMKPISPDINNALASWVSQGGTLIYVGDSSDPYHSIDSWWNNTSGVSYKDPSHHLFDLLGFDANITEGIYNVKKGIFVFMKQRPADFCISKEKSSQYRSFIRNILSENSEKWEDTSTLLLRRGNYIIATVMDEGTNEPKEIKGLFVDLFSPDFSIVKNKVINKDENTLLYDLSKIENLSSCIIGTTNRIESFDLSDKGFSINAKGASNLKAYIRIKLPNQILKIESKMDVTITFDKDSGTYLISYDSSPTGIHIKGLFV